MAPNLFDILNMTYLAEFIRGVQTAGLKLQNPPRKNTAGVPDWRPAGEVTTEWRRTSRLTANITPACPAYTHKSLLQ